MPKPFSLLGFLGLKKEGPKDYIPANTLNGFTPTYMPFGTNIYLSDVVVQAISCITTEIAKHEPKHMREKGVTDTSFIDGNIQSVLLNPNPWMTVSDYLERITYALLSECNSFVIPTWTEHRQINGEIKRTYTGLYPILPANIQIIQDPSEELFIKFRFTSGFETTYRYADVIHTRTQYIKNDYLGGDINGNPDHRALLKTLELNQSLLTGLQKMTDSAYMINGIIRYNTLIDDGTIATNIKSFEKQLQENKTAILGTDLKGEFIPLKRDTKLVDPATIQFIDTKILRNWGISIPILNGDYTREQYEAFYQKTIEPLVIRLSQSHTKTLFSKRERAYGNKVNFLAKSLMFMTMAQKLELVRLLGQSGTMYENEKRIAVGLMPLPELEGVRLRSLNYVSLDIADAYQLGRAFGDIGETGKIEDEETVTSEEEGNEDNGGEKNA